MAKLVFDIETSALPIEHFDEAQQEYLFRECEKIADEVARAERRAELTRQCSLWPFTSQVEDRQMKDLPPLDAYAPRTNCSCPPVPLIWR